MSAANDHVIIGTITMDYEQFYKYLDTRPDEEIKECAQRILSIAQKKSIDVNSTSISPENFAAPDFTHNGHPQEHHPVDSLVHDAVTQESANWAKKLTGLKEFDGPGSCGTKYTTTLDGAKVLIKVDQNAITCDDNALSSESEYIFFKWVSDTFSHWPEEIVEPVFFGSLPPDDVLYQHLDQEMFAGNFHSKTNVSQNNMFVVILPFGEANECNSDGHEEAIKAFLTKFEEKVSLPSEVNQSVLLKEFKRKMDHANASNSIMLDGVVKLIDFGKWGIFTKWCLKNQITYSPEHCPKWYDMSIKRPRTS